MERAEPQDPGKRVGESESTTGTRLGAIESHLQLIEALLIGFGQFNARLDQIHATLELAIGVLSPDQQTGSHDKRTGAQDDETRDFRVITHFTRQDNGARLISDVWWADIWSVRLYVTALLRNALRSGLASAECNCWSEVWSPDDTGDLIDSARVHPETGLIEWDSDMDAGK